MAFPALQTARWNVIAIVGWVVAVSLVLFAVVLWFCCPSLLVSLDRLFHNIQHFFDVLASLSFGRWSINFAGSFVAAFISFPLFQFFNLKKESLRKDNIDLLSMLLRFKEAKKGVRYDLFCFTLRYAAAAGLLAAAAIHMHSGGLKLDLAIFLGFIGPFIMREKLVGQFELSAETNVAKALTNFVDDSESQMEIIKQIGQAPSIEKGEERSIAKAMQEEIKEIKEKSARKDDDTKGQEP
ncbi:MAG: hypothetical protein HY913_16555 [Desulfomonile tiedjei]|nr:hypothetical protein [Desulfomonile tiedjei]